LFPEILELSLTQVLGEHICGIVTSVNKVYRDLVLFNTFPDIVVMKVYVLRVSFLHRIVRYEDGAFNIRICPKNIPISANTVFIYTACQLQSERAIYSASVDESTTVF